MPQAARPSDPADPRTWWVGLVDAVAGLQRGDVGPASTYLRFVETHRGRDAAVRSKFQLRTLQRSEAFDGCHRWHENNYQPGPRRAARKRG